MSAPPRCSGSSTMNSKPALRTRNGAVPGPIHSTKTRSQPSSPVPRRGAIPGPPLPPLDQQHPCHDLATPPPRPFAPGAVAGGLAAAPPCSGSSTASRRSPPCSCLQHGAADAPQPSRARSTSPCRLDATSRSLEDQPNEDHLVGGAQVSAVAGCSVFSRRRQVTSGQAGDSPALPRLLVSTRRGQLHARGATEAGDAAKRTPARRHPVPPNGAPGLSLAPLPLDA